MENLPELSLVYPLPGFPALRRFVLVRIDGEGAEADATAAPAEHEIHAGEAAAGSDSPDVAGPGAPVLFELRSVEQPDIRFLVGVPNAFFADYEVELDDETCSDLDLADPADALVLVIMSVGADLGAATANLLAPVVINTATRTAAQVILSGTDWPVRASVG